MPIGVGYSTPGGDAIILPIGEHPCKLVSVELVPGENPQTKEPNEQIKFTFQSLTWKDPQTGKPGTISQWTGLKYGNNKAKLTALLDMIFGRALSQQEAELVDMEKLVGLKGYAMVVPYTKEDGTPGRKFGGFRHPDNTSSPAPSVFYADAQAVAPPPSRPARTNSRPQPTPTKQEEVDLPNPFGDGAAEGAPAGDPFKDE